MFERGQKVKCKETGLVGTVDDREWENGWRYTLVTDEGKFLYRDEDNLIMA